MMQLLSKADISFPSSVIGMATHIATCCDRRKFSVVVDSDPIHNVPFSSENVIQI
jgi:hypothetical protein